MPRFFELADMRSSVPLAGLWLRDAITNGRFWSFAARFDGIAKTGMHVTNKKLVDLERIDSKAVSKARSFSPCFHMRVHVEETCDAMEERLRKERMMYDDAHDMGLDCKADYGCD